MDKEKIELYAPAIVIVTLFAGLIALNLFVKKYKDIKKYKEKWAMDFEHHCNNKNYDFSSPSKTILLPESLNEISGLSLFNDSIFFAVQDEEGIIYEIDKNGNVKETDFHKAGDYEGIERVADSIFIIKSTGTLYKITNYGKTDQQREKISNFLDESYDTEGIAYDKKTHSLLLSCKVCNKKKNKGNRLIYRYDIAKKELIESPYISISISSVETFIKNCIVDNPDAVQKMLKQFLFAPSAIAVHPITDHIFISSSQGKNIVEINRKGEIISFNKLDKGTYLQPEGLAFSPDGTLYVSNEAKDKKPLIYQVDWKRGIK